MHGCIPYAPSAQEVLKARRAGVVGGDSGNIAQQHRQQQQQQGTGGFGGTTNSGGGNNKRYMILTYAAEYDRVHYPLPLACVASPEREEPDRTADSPGEVTKKQAGRDTFFFHPCRSNSVRTRDWYACDWAGCSWPINC